MVNANCCAAGYRYGQFKVEVFLRGQDNQKILVKIMRDSTLFTDRRMREGKVETANMMRFEKLFYFQQDPIESAIVCELFINPTQIPSGVVAFPTIRGLIMAVYHTKYLKLLLERVAYKGYAKEGKAFFLRAYGGGQKRFTVAVRERIKEIWETVREDMEDVLNDDLSGVDLRFLETLDGDVLVFRDDLEWED